MKTKLVTGLLALGLVAGGAGGVVAAGGGSDGGNASNAQYKPGKGCGDRNHDHTGPPGNPSNDDCPSRAGRKR